MKFYKYSTGGFVMRHKTIDKSRKKMLEKSCARPIDEKAQRLRSSFFTISYLPLALNYILFYHKLYVNTR